MTRRIILVVLDSVGIGELPDAKEYGDEGSNTLVNLSRAVGGLKLPNLTKLGLGNITEIEGVSKVNKPSAAFGKMQQLSKGKDTTTGHWEISGIVLDVPFRTYPNGFPSEIITEFEKLIGMKTLGNVVASGTEIIKVLGEEHVKTGYPIIYTSADSVFQIAAHEEIIPLERLYEICQIARKLLTGEHQVGRVIARPFIGEIGDFSRTPNRRDYAVLPPHDTILDVLKKNEFEVMAVGKIEDIFAGRGITHAVHTKNNADSIERTISSLGFVEGGLIFSNLVDFDMLYGHRNDVEGYAKALHEFDTALPDIIASLTEEDILIITADHGNDPTTPSTDHSREYVPLLVYGEKIKGIDLGIRKSFADIGATIADYFNTEKLKHGQSFLDEILWTGDFYDCV